MACVPYCITCIEFFIFRLPILLSIYLLGHLCLYPLVLIALLLHHLFFGFRGLWMNPNVGIKIKFLQSIVLLLTVIPYCVLGDIVKFGALTLYLPVRGALLFSKHPLDWKKFKYNFKRNFRHWESDLNDRSQFLKEELVWSELPPGERPMDLSWMQLFLFPILFFIVFALTPIVSLPLHIALFPSWCRMVKDLAKSVSVGRMLHGDRSRRAKRCLFPFYAIYTLIFFVVAFIVTLVYQLVYLPALTAFFLLRTALVIDSLWLGIKSFPYIIAANDLHVRREYLDYNQTDIGIWYFRLFPERIPVSQHWQPELDVVEQRRQRRWLRISFLIHARNDVQMERKWRLRKAYAAVFETR